MPQHQGSCVCADLVCVTLVITLLIMPERNQISKKRNLTQSNTCSDEDKSKDTRNNPEQGSRKLRKEQGLGMETCA